MSSETPKDSFFPSTRWTQLKTLQHGEEGEAQQAFETICQRYWYPIYAFLRRSGHSPSDAEDHTQSFFQRLVSERALVRVHPERGKLRSYLLGVLKHYLSDHRLHDHRLKRGGGQKLISIDEAMAENRYGMEPKDLNTPDLLFDRAWAINVLTEATAKLRKVFAESMNEDAFDHLSEFLPLGANDTAYRKIASRMGVKENSVRLQVRRMRQSYRRIIEEYIAKTVGPTAAAEELQHLMAVVRTPLSGDL